MAKIDVSMFGFILGCVWGMSVLILSGMAAIFHRGVKVVELFSKVYIGYKPTSIGVLIGVIWGFVDGVISGMLIAWIYNRFVS